MVTMVADAADVCFCMVFDACKEFSVGIVADGAEDAGKYEERKDSMGITSFKGGLASAMAFGLIAPGMAFAADADHTPAVTGEDVKVTAAEEGGSEGTTAVT